MKNDPDYCNSLMNVYLHEYIEPFVCWILHNNNINDEVKNNNDSDDDSDSNSSDSDTYRDSENDGN